MALREPHEARAAHQAPPRGSGQAQTRPLKPEYHAEAPERPWAGEAPAAALCAQLSQQAFVMVWLLSLIHL